MTGLVRLLAIALGALPLGCSALAPSPDHTVALGTTSDGYLVHGKALADRGPGFVRARPGEPTRYGTEALRDTLTRAAAAVAHTFPGTEPLRVGDLSYPFGGRHPRHRSHRVGRDVDVIFYLVDEGGRSVRGRGWLAMDRHGMARDPGAGDVLFFDTARNWHFVRTLLADGGARIQWIFCSREVKARLLEYAAAVEPDPTILARAAWVLHQPSRGHPHDDHFHVRIFCDDRERAEGCIDTEPFWPWTREAEKVAVGTFPRPDHSDAALVRLLTEDP
ncbi:MAG: penicillin-insensitive murein endopeptidase [Myxococcales bacterium]|nr:penicillin-insensitive murein endopeptidase [Myxococcales bacterium]